MPGSTIAKKLIADHDHQDVDQPGRQGRREQRPYCFVDVWKQVVNHAL